MSICLGTGAKAWNSSLLAKGAADWSAAGAHLKDFPLKRSLKVDSPQTSQRGGGCQWARWRSKVSKQLFVRNFGHVLETQLFIRFDDIGRISWVAAGSQVHPKTGGILTPLHPWAHKYVHVVLKSVPSGPEGMKMQHKVVPSVPHWC